MDDLKYQCEPTEFHEKRVSIKFTCDRGVSHEFVRHRVFSFAQESTRYCNYAKDKFGNELTFIIPSHVNLKPGNYLYQDENPFITAGGYIQQPGWDDYVNLKMKLDDGSFVEVKHHYDDFAAVEAYCKSLQESGYTYLSLIDAGWTPQQARAVLPNSLKTELVMTGSIDQWIGFFNLRCPKSAHPDARKLALDLLEKMYNMYPEQLSVTYKKYITDVDEQCVDKE